jgi:hypothetical protein
MIRVLPELVTLRSDLKLPAVDLLSSPGTPNETVPFFALGEKPGKKTAFS